MGIIIPLCLIRRLRILAFTSLFGIAALLAAVVAVMTDASARSAPEPFRNLDPVNLDTYPLFLGNAAFLYLISTAILPLYQDMDAESLPYFRVTFDSSTLFVTILNLGFGLFAWTQYGTCVDGHDHNCVQGNVIDNLSVGPLKTVVQLLLCVDLIFTSVVFLYPFNEALERTFLTGSMQTNLCSVHEWKRNILRTFTVLMVGLVAYLVPSFSLLTGLTGGFGNNILGFILPTLFYWRLQSQVCFSYLCIKCRTDTGRNRESVDTWSRLHCSLYFYSESAFFT